MSSRSHHTAFSLFIPVEPRPRPYLSESAHASLELPPLPWPDQVMSLIPLPDSTRYVGQQAKLIDGFSSLYRIPVQPEEDSLLSEYLKHWTTYVISLYYLQTHYIQDNGQNYLLEVTCALKGAQLFDDSADVEGECLALERFLFPKGLPCTESEKPGSSSGTSLELFSPRPELSTVSASASQPILAPFPIDPSIPLHLTPVDLPVPSSPPILHPPPGFRSKLYSPLPEIFRTTALTPRLTTYSPPPVDYYPPRSPSPTHASYALTPGRTTPSDLSMAEDNPLSDPYSSATFRDLGVIDAAMSPGDPPANS